MMHILCYLIGFNGKEILLSGLVNFTKNSDKCTLRSKKSGYKTDRCFIPFGKSEKHLLNGSLYDCWCDLNDSKAFCLQYENIPIGRSRQSDLDKRKYILSKVVTTRNNDSTQS